MGLRQKTLQRRTHRYWHLVFFAVVLAVVFVAVRALGPVLTPVAAAMILSYLLDPVVTRLERYRIPRWAGSAILFVVALLLLTLSVLLLEPVVVREIKRLPGYLEHVRGSLIPWIESTFQVQVPHSFTDIWESFGADVKVMASKGIGPLGGAAGKLVKGTAGFFSALGTVVLVPVFVFYFLPKFPAIIASARELIPYRYRDWVDATAREIDAALSSWIRGQLTVMFCLAVLYAIGLSVIAPKLPAVLIGGLTGLFSFIPYVGFGLGLGAAALACLAEYGADVHLVGVVAVFVGVQVLDGLAITPRIVGSSVGLGPVGVLLALMLGGSLFGFVGVLLAVPTAAVLVVLLKRAVEAYQGSLFFRKGIEGYQAASEAAAAESEGAAAESVGAAAAASEAGAPPAAAVDPGAGEADPPASGGAATRDAGDSEAGGAGKDPGGD